MTSYANHEPLIEKLNKSEFTIKIANTLEERESAFRLAYQVYLEKGYIKNNANEWMIQPYDANPETITLIVQDDQKQIAGTITLVFSESTKLPAERIYSDEIASLKAKSDKMVEISRLAINPEYRNSKEVMQLLINYLMIYSSYVKNYTSLVIQVNPRHVCYYKTLLKFDEIGTEKACPSVQNAPAILLHLPLSRCHAEIMRYSNAAIGEKRDRSLYQYFLKHEQENLVAHYLAKQAKSMSGEERIYFGFTESGISRAVCV
jgi:hypothetical protein